MEKILKANQRTNKRTNKTSECEKSEKTNDEISGLRHILGIAILYLCAKNQKKKLTSRYREKRVKD